MFGGTESGTNKLGTVMVPTRFVWPYGGRRVLLSGTFTRWQDHIPMSPMEGCPTVFQVIYNLTPGYHQVNPCGLRLQNMIGEIRPASITYSREASCSLMFPAFSISVCQSANFHLV